mgnify:CR=1 FL=1
MTLRARASRLNSNHGNKGIADQLGACWTDVRCLDKIYYNLVSCGTLREYAHA